MARTLAALETPWGSLAEGLGGVFLLLWMLGLGAAGFAWARYRCSPWPPLFAAAALVGLRYLANVLSGIWDPFSGNAVVAEALASLVSTSFAVCFLMVAVFWSGWGIGWLFRSTEPEVH